MNMLKKVQFYQSEKAGKYQVPTELNELVSITDEAVLKALIERNVAVDIAKQKKKDEAKLADISKSLN